MIMQTVATQLIPKEQRELAAIWLNQAHIELQLAQKALEEKSTLSATDVENAERHTTRAGCRLGKLVSMMRGNPLPRRGE